MISRQIYYPPKQKRTFLHSYNPNRYKSTILPNQSGHSNIPTIQTTDSKIISRQISHTKVNIPTLLPFKPLQIRYPTIPKWRSQHSYHSNLYKPTILPKWTFLHSYYPNLQTPKWSVDGSTRLPNTPTTIAFDTILANSSSNHQDYFPKIRTSVRFPSRGMSRLLQL